MNHKLHNTILASAIVGAALLFGLLAAQPVRNGAHQPGVHHQAARSAGSMIAGDLRSDLARDMERRARRLETDLGTAGSAGEALTMASALFASSVMEATLATVLEDIGHYPPPAPRTHAATGEAERARAARSHSAMAMPYFSTARSARHGDGE